MNITWDAESYRDSFGYVPAYGAGVVDDLAAAIDLDGARVVDLGCGNGTLTAQLAERGADVTGIDASAELLDLARRTHPGIRFEHADARSFHLCSPADAVFSNAVLHWIDAADHPRVLARVRAALRPGGVFVFESGGAGNTARINAGLARAFAARGLDYEVPFHFPTIGEYAPLLEAAGLLVDTAALFPRWTPLTGPDGLADWIRMFVRVPFEGLDDATADAIIADTVTDCAPDLLDDGTWHADYVRLRMRAHAV